MNQLEKKPEEKEVFCNKCKYLGYSSMGRPKSCTYPSNFVTEKTYYSKKTHMDETPEELNKNNDCRWYKRKSLWDYMSK